MAGAVPVRLEAVERRSLAARPGRQRLARPTHLRRPPARHAAGRRRLRLSPAGLVAETTGAAGPGVAGRLRSRTCAATPCCRAESGLLPSPVRHLWELRGGRLLPASLPDCQKVGCLPLCSLRTRAASLGSAPPGKMIATSGRLAASSVVRLRAAAVGPARLKADFASLPSDADSWDRASSGEAASTSGAIRHVLCGLLLEAVVWLKRGK